MIMNRVNLHSWRVDIKEAIQIQESLRKRIILGGNLPKIQRVVGVDVAFYNNQAVCAICILEYPGLNLIETIKAKEPIAFPYVPGLLTFREGPVILKAIGKLKNKHKPDLILFDGQGICHPRRMGIATHLGIILDVPSIGCAKSPLYGFYEMPAENKGSYSFIYDKNTVLSQNMNTSIRKNQKGYGEELAWSEERSDRQRGKAKAPMGSVVEGVATNKVLGVALRTRRQVKPLFISCGYRVSLMPAVRLVLRLCPKYRIPQPIRYAHQLAQDAKFSI